MPIRRRNIRRRKDSRLDDIPPAHLLRFLAGWHPPTTPFEASRSRWQTWDEYLGEYEQVRDEFLSSDFCEGRDEPPFAEVKLREFREGLL